MSTIVQSIHQKTVAPPSSEFGRKLFFVCLRIAIGIAIVLLLVPVLLLPFFTAVSAPIWISLMVGDVVLLTLLLRVARGGWTAGDNTSRYFPRCALGGGGIAVVCGNSADYGLAGQATAE